MSVLYTDFSFGQGAPAITSKNDGGRDLTRPLFPIKTNSYNTAHLNNEQFIFQQNPLPTSGIEWEHLRSFTYSLQSYELHAKQHYIQLIRNFDYTKQYPDYHVIVNFYKQMPIEDFRKIQSKAFGYLARWGVSGYYVLEPTLSRNWLHTHLITIYGRSQGDLRECIKLAFTYAGLTYDKDFHIKIFSVGATDKDYKRLCAYILKFNGKRKTNRYTPVLFIKGLGLRKTGSFGKWFAKPNGKIWKEYKEELRKEHERQAWLDFN
jgi:hypothetical protein